METKRCDFSGGDVDATSTVVYRLLTVVEMLSGMSLNIFIIAVNAATGLQNWGLRPVEQILTALGISRFLYLCLFMSKLLCTAVIPWVFEVTRLYQTFKVAIWFLTCTSLFFSASLCAFYCAKIAQFRQRTFILFKTKINQLVPWLLFFSVVISLINTTPFFYGIYEITCGEKQNVSAAAGNGTLVESSGLETNRFNLFLFCGIGFSMGFFLLAILAFLLLFSLWQHTKTCTTSFSDPNLDAHFQAVKIILSLLLTEVVNFITLIVLLSNIFLDKSPEHRFCTFIILLCPTLQSSILIWGNPKLKGAVVAAVLCCNRRLALS